MNLTTKNKWQKPVKSLITYLLVLGIIGITLINVAGYLSGNIVSELVSHFKLQYLVISLLLFGLILLSRQKIFIIIALLCVSSILIEIVPWYIPQEKITGENNTLTRVFLSNVSTDNQSYSKVLSLVREQHPDIAVFIEVTDAWIRKLKSLNDILPYSIAKANYNNLEIAVFSQLPLKNKSIEFFGDTKNGTILADLTINGQIISLIATHPQPPVKPEWFQSRNQQLDEVSQYIQQLKTPVLLVGDLNITMWSPYYKSFVNQTGLRNASQGFGILPTWPTKSSLSPVSAIIAPLLSIPIDHCLISPEIKVANIRTGPNINSDHLPVIADLVIPQKK